MLTRLRQTVGGSSFRVRAGLLAVAAAAFIFMGWFVGDRFWKEGVWGAFWAFYLGLGILGCVTYRPARAVFARAIVAFVIAVPVVYALVLIAQLALSLLNLTHFNAQEFFLKSTVGALVGVACGIFLSIKGTFNKVYEEKTTGIYGRYSITELFQVEVLALFPIGIGAALLMTVPAEPLARIILSIFWGFFSAVCGVLFTVLIDREPATDAVMYIFMAEILIFLILVGNALESMSGKDGSFHVQKIYEGLELAVPAAVTCIAVYLLVCLCSAIGKRVKRANPDVPEETLGDMQQQPA
jgi:hypothetical protein